MALLTAEPVLPDKVTGREREADNEQGELGKENRGTQKERVRRQRERNKP